MALQTVCEDSKTEQREACQCKCGYKKAGGKFDFPSQIELDSCSDLSLENVTRVWSEKRKLLNWIMLKVHK